jgi:CHASE2 domain-containing sensor protein
MNGQKKPEVKKSRFPRNFCLIFSVVFIVLWSPNLIGLPSFFGAFYHAEDVWADALFRWRRNSLPAGDPRIILAALDEETGRKYGFPVPRGVQARLLDKFKEYGVKTVAFDVMFFDPREGDQELSAATKRFGRVVHLYALEPKVTAHGTVMTLSEPIAPLKGVAQYLGFPNVQDILDTDGHMRRSIFFDPRARDPRDENQIAASMDVVTVASFLNRPLSEIQSRYYAPDEAPFLINFRKPLEWLRHEKRDSSERGRVQNLETVDSPYQRLSAIDILDGELTSEQKQALKGSQIGRAHV